MTIKNLPFKLFIVPLLISACVQNIGNDPVQIPLADLHPDVLAEYQNISSTIQCGPPYECNNIIVFDCASIVDGPKNYYDNLTGLPVMYCGGACMFPKPTDPLSCKACPPKEWICSATVP